jgi:hypothetical protein
VGEAEGDAVGDSVGVPDNVPPPLAVGLGLRELPEPPEPVPEGVLEVEPEGEADDVGKDV